VAAVADFTLDDRVAVVTGARGSLGRAISLTLAEAGADVALCDREEQGHDELAHEVEALGRRALPVRCDVTEQAEVDAAVAETLATLGRLDVLVANAGVFQTWMAPEENTREEWDRVLGVNLTGVWLSCHAAGLAMMERGGGSIVTISSIVGLSGLEGNFSYNVAKHGVIGLTRTLALEWAPHGIRVNAVCPGFCKRDPEPLLAFPETVEMILDRTPMHQWGRPRDIGLACLYLASPASAFVTGIALPVDGGWLAR
jgi:NAD(P)-dependent dehydrogenase (short-subunit alcohol dehydrogenase family)